MGNGMYTVLCIMYECHINTALDIAKLCFQEFHLLKSFHAEASDGTKQSKTTTVK